MEVRDTGYISRMLMEASNHHSGLTAELMEGAASEIDLLADEKADLVVKVDHLTCQKNACQQVIVERDAEIEHLKSTIKAVHTWALFDLERGCHLALSPRDVAKLCESSLKGDK